LNNYVICSKIHIYLHKRQVVSKNIKNVLYIKYKNIAKFE